MYWVFTAVLVDSPLNRAFGKGFLALRHVRHNFREASLMHRLNIAFRFLVLRRRRGR